MRSMSAHLVKVGFAFKIYTLLCVASRPKGDDFRTGYILSRRPVSFKKFVILLMSKVLLSANISDRVGLL